MRLVDTDIERRVRAKVYAKVLEKGPVWTQMNYGRYRDREQGILFGVHLLFPLLLVFLSAPARSPLTAMAALSLVTLSLPLAHLDLMVTMLTRSWELFALAVLPVSDRDFLIRQTVKVAKRSMWMTGMIGLAYAIVVSQFEVTWVGWSLAAGAWIAHVAVVTALMPLILHRMPWLPLKKAAIGLFAAAAALVIANLAFGIGAIERGLEAWPWLGHAFLPTGWATGLLNWGALQGKPAALLLLIPIAMLARLGVASWRWLVGIYRIANMVDVPRFSAEAYLHFQEQAVLAVESERNEALLESPELKPQVREAFRNHRDDFFRKQVRSRQFLAPVQWKYLGRMAALVSRALDARQRVVAHMMLITTPRWDFRWLAGVVVLAAGATGTWMTASTIPALPYAAALLGVGIACPALGGTWPGLHWLLHPNHAMPLFGAFPVSATEVVRTAVRINAVRCAAFIVPLIAFGIACDLAQGGIAITLVSLKAGFTALLFQPLAFCMKVSEGVDARAFGSWERLAIAFAVILLSVMTIASFFIPYLLPSAALMLPMGLLARWIPKGYVRIWESRLVDWTVVARG